MDDIVKGFAIGCGAVFGVIAAIVVIIMLMAVLAGMGDDEPASKTNVSEEVIEERGIVSTSTPDTVESSMTVIPAVAYTPTATQPFPDRVLCERGNTEYEESLMLAGIAGYEGDDAKRYALSISGFSLWEYGIDNTYDFAQFLKRCHSAGFTGTGF